MNLFRQLPLAAALSITLAAGPSFAQDAAKPSPTVAAGASVPVYPYDITDRQYQVLGTVTAGVRKSTIFSSEASQGKIYKELWERASKLGADAVVKANYGESHVSAFSWGKTNATGMAIKFTDGAGPYVPASATGPAPTDDSTATAPAATTSSTTPQ